MSQLETENQQLEIIREIEEETKKSLERVRAFFLEYGITLKRDPKVRYVDENCPLNPRMVAAANVDIESSRQLLGLIGGTVLKLSYKRFGLDISDDSINETIQVSQMEIDGLMKGTSLFDEGEDIVFFHPIQRELDQLDSVMAHECWHLCESDEGVISTEPLIREATASYVQNLIAKKSCKNPVIEDFFDIIYKLGAAIVEEEVENEDNPLKAVLNKDVRIRIGLRFQNEVLPAFHKKIESFNLNLFRGTERSAIKNLDAYDAFRRTPSLENLLVSLEKRGYKLLAEELRKKDCQKLIEHLRSLLDDL